MKLFDFFRKKTSSSSTPPPKNFEDLRRLDALRNKQEIHTDSWVDKEIHEEITTQYSDESIISVSSKPDDFITEFYRLSEIIGSGKNPIKNRLDACEKSLAMLPEFCRMELKDYGEVPPLINCRDYGVELYLRLGDWENARRVIFTCINAKAYTQEEGNEVLENFHAYRKAAETAMSYIAEHPGCLQKDMYKALGLDGNDKEQLKHFLRSSLQIQKEKYNSTNKLFVNTDAVV